MQQINLGETGVFEINPDNLPLDDNLDEILYLCEEVSTLKELIPVAMLYYDQNFQNEFLKILKFIIKKSTFIDEVQQTAQSLYNAYYINNNLYLENKLILNEKTSIDKIIKGFYYLKIKDLNSAEIYFENFEFGMEIINFKKGIKKQYKNSILRNLNNYLNMEEYSEEEFNNKIKFKINKKEIENIKKEEINDFLEGKFINNWYLNTDFLLALAEKYIEDDIFLKIIEKIESNSEKYFLIGKFYHKKLDLQKAVDFYKKSELAESNYNLNRIKQDNIFDLIIKNKKTINFYSFICSKMNLPGLPCEVNDFYKSISDSTFYNLRKLIDSQYVEQSSLFINIGVYLYLELEKYFSCNEEFIALNIPTNPVLDNGILSLAELNLDFKNGYFKIKNQIEIIKQIFLRSKKNENSFVIEHNLQLLNNICNNNNIYISNNYNEVENLLKEGFELLKNNELEKSLSIFIDLNSIYAKNGASICFIRNKKYKEAKEILNRVTLELPFAFINLGNIYYLIQDYEKAINCYKKIPLCNYTLQMFINISNKLRNNTLLKEIYQLIPTEELNKEIVKINLLNESKAGG